MSEEFETNEEFEAARDVGEEVQELNTMTNEPGEYIETNRTVGEAETIETAFTEVMQIEEASTLSESIPDPSEELESNVEITDPNEEISGLPLPIPGDTEEVGAQDDEMNTSEVIGDQNDEIGLSPIPIPRPDGEVDSVQDVEIIFDGESFRIP